MEAGTLRRMDFPIRAGVCSFSSLLFALVPNAPHRYRQYAGLALVVVVYVGGIVGWSCAVADLRSSSRSQVSPQSSQQTLRFQLAPRQRASAVFSERAPSASLRRTAARSLASSSKPLLPFAAPVRGSGLGVPEHSLRPWVSATAFSSRAYGSRSPVRFSLISLSATHGLRELRARHWS